jgi:hypothetical protein
MIRASLVLATGSVTFWTAAQMGAPQVQLGDPVSGTGGAATTVHAGTAGIGVGNNYTPATGATGAIYEFQLLDGSGGPLADPVFTDQPPGATSFADAQGNVWTMTGTAELSQRSYRYHGEMSSQPKATDPSLTDVYVPLACGGIWRRLQQANAPEYSPMRRAIQAQAGTLTPVAYWPGEDLQGSTVLGSGTGGPSMTVSGGTGDGSVTTTGPAFASDSTFACSSALPVLNGSSWHGAVPAYESSGSLIVRFLLNIPSTAAAATPLMRVITTGTCQELSLYWNSGGTLSLAGYGSGGQVFSSGPVSFNVDGTPVLVSMELRPGFGPAINWWIEVLAPGESSGLSFSGIIIGSVGKATDIYVSPAGLMSQVTVGHIQVQSDWVSLFSVAQPLNAWSGETAGSRFARLCGENGIAARITGPPDLSAAMGAQPVDTLPDLLQQCEDADRGMITEPRESYSLGYRTLVSLLNQAAAVTLDWASAALAAQGWKPPTSDDQYTVNDVTLTRESGGSSGSSGATFRTYLGDGSPMSISQPPDGAGDYATSLSVNVQADTQLPDLAGWMVHVGTVDEDRWPAIPLDLSRPAVAALFWALQDIGIGDRVDQVNLPPWASWNDVRQLAAGVTEEIGGYFWRIAWNGIPESAYETMVLDDPVYGRAGTGGSSLSVAVSATATTLQVATVDGAPLWTTDEADFPFGIQVHPAGAPGKGEQVTVTGISGTSSPQTFTVIRSVNGVVAGHGAGETVSLFWPPVLAIA